MNTISKLPGPLLVFFGALSLSFGGLIVKSFQGANLWQILFWRSIFFILVVSIFLILTYRKKVFTAFVSSGNSSMAIGFPGNGIISLGDGGEAILTFENPIMNGNGWDFAVFENSFSDTYLELGFVEVSSNGHDFYRFEATSLTQDSIQIDAFGSVNTEKIEKYIHSAFLFIHL